MEKTAIFAWTALKKYYSEKISTVYNNIIFNDSKETYFIERFKSMYEAIQHKMSHTNTEEKGDPALEDATDKKNIDEEHLDRHKQAAILIYCVIQEEIFMVDNVPKDHVFVGNYSIALALGLTYLKDRLNEVLEAVGEKQIEEFSEIVPFTCDTPIFDVIYRNLYFEQETDKNAHVFTLSNTLFLYEYITLLENGIDPRALKEKINNTKM